MKHDIQLTGLENLVNKASLNETNPFNTKFVSINKLQEHEFNEGRQTKENVELIKQSIIEAGLLQPLLVYKTEDGFYKIISGHGRYRALQQLNEYKFNGSIYQADEIPVMIDREEKEDLDYQLNILRANAQKDELMQEKIENVRKAQDLYNKLRMQNKISSIDKTKKRIWISQLTGYSESSVKQYLQKINGNKDKEDKKETLAGVYKKLFRIEEMLFYNMSEQDITMDKALLHKTLRLLEEMQVFLNDLKENG